MFTQSSHHRNISVVFLAQNLFPKNKFARTVSLNAHYMVLFKNPRDVSQFANLARQMYPKKSQFSVEAYRDATREPYSYLSVDLRPKQDEELRLRTNIFPRETHYVYECMSQYRTEMSRRTKKFLPVLTRIRKWTTKRDAIMSKSVTESLSTV